MHFQPIWIFRRRYSHLEFGWAAIFIALVIFVSGIVQFSLPVHDVTESVPRGMSFSNPSHQKPPSLVSATFVKTVFFCIVAIALGFVDIDVPVDNKNFHKTHRTLCSNNILK